MPPWLTDTHTDNFRPAVLLAQPAQTYNALLYTSDRSEVTINVFSQNASMQYHHMMQELFAPL